MALTQMTGCAQQVSRLAPMLPPPPGSQSLQQLAKSPSSALLASEFFRTELQRDLFRKQPALATADSQLEPSALSSSEPHYSSSLDGALRLDQYLPLSEIYDFLERLAARYKHVQVFTIGRTAENRPIKALELVNNATDADFVWLDALTHAREWITGSTIVYIIDQLVSGQRQLGQGPLHSKNYIIVPVVNPDGYVYTWTTNRMWRKNRARSPSRGPESKCVGADLNRNFDHTFGGEGSSNDPCSHIYSGAYPFSELETKSMADLMWSLKERIKFYLTIHSYNQLWACPYAHTTEGSRSLAKHMRVLRSIQRAVEEAEGVRYEIGPLGASLYVGSGFGLDFAYDKCGIEHSYLVELRDKGANGFVLPPDQIMPTARETLAGLRAGLRAALG